MAGFPIGFPLGDWQFWVVTAVPVLIGVWCVRLAVRSLVRGTGAGPGGTRRRATLTVSAPSGAAERDA